MFRTTLLALVGLTLAACPQQAAPDAGACQLDGLAFGGSLGLRVEFTGRVDGEGRTATGDATMFQAPAAPIVIPLSAPQLEVTPASLTYTPENWNVPQRITLRARSGVTSAELTGALQLGPTESELEALRCQTGTDPVPLPRCGDGIVDGFLREQCEPPNPRLVCPPGQATCQICNTDCQFMAGFANLCGDGQVTADEDCDGRPRKTCEQAGFDFGVITCSSTTCQHDTSECVRVGCDGGSCDPRFPALPPVDGAECLPGADGRARCFGSSAVGHHRPPAVPFSQLADGLAHACGVGPLGQVRCWGSNDAGAATAPTGAFSKVVVGHFHSCGLTVGGGVTCWGSDEYRLSQVPDGGPFVDLASGDNHVCALTASGEAKCWGRRAEAQLFIPGAPRFTRIGAAANHGCGLTAVGDITCWGNFGRGQKPLAIDAAWPFVDLKVLRQDVCGLTADARIVCASSSPGTPNQNTGDLALPGGFTPVSLGDASSGLCALDARGEAHCWGTPEPQQPLKGQFSRVDTGAQFCGRRLDGGVSCGLSSVTSAAPLKQLVKPDIDTTCSVDENGTAECTMVWGRVGQMQSAPAPAVPFSRVVVFDKVACGLRTTGTVICWGEVPNGGTGVPQDVMTDFAHNGSTGCGILGTGALSCWGIDPFGIRVPPSGTFTQVRMNRLFACALRTDGSLVCWGTEVPPFPTGAGFTALAMSEAGGVCALAADSKLTCWGTEQRTRVPRENFGSLAAGPVWASGRTLDGGLRFFGAAAFQPGSVALVEAPIDDVVMGGRRFCVRSRDRVMCLTSESTGVGLLQDLGAEFAVSDERLCWLVDGGLPRCGSNPPPPQEPLGIIRLGGSLLRGITLDGGDLYFSNRDRRGGPFSRLESTPLTFCAQHAATGSWTCEGVADAGVTTPGTERFERLSIAFSEDLACGVYGDGGSRCWGKGLSKPMGSVPPGPWVDLRLGRSHGCGLRPTGAVQCWGESQVGVLTAPASAFDSIGSGIDLSCGIRRSDRQLVCWGAYGVNWTQ